MGLNEGWDVGGFDRLGWLIMELRSVLDIVLCMLITAYSMHILRCSFILVCSPGNCASSIELVATRYAEWHPGGWEEGNWRSLRSEEHSALVLRSLESYREGRTPSLETGN